MVEMMTTDFTVAHYDTHRSTKETWALICAYVVSYNNMSLYYNLYVKCYSNKSILANKTW